MSRHGGTISINPRVFLAAYMIAYRRNKVFETIGERERVLYLCSGPVVESFEIIANAVLADGDFSTVPHEVSSEFIPLVVEYVRRFSEWKVSDESRLARRIKDALLALYSVESQHGVTSLEFTAQIEKLRGRLSSVAGADALAAFDVERRAHVVGPHRRSRFPVRMTNEQLTHELMYDLEFQLVDNMAFNWEGDVLARKREQFHCDFWRVLLEELRDRNVSKAVRALLDIRCTIHELHPEEAVFNEEYIENVQNLVDNGALIADSIVDVIVRKQNVARAVAFAPAWATLRVDLDTGNDKSLVFRNAIRFLQDHVEKMRLDVINANLRVISAVVQNNGVDYERGKFQMKLDDGMLTLERTEAWLADVKPIDADAKRAYLKAMVNLVARTTPVTEDVCPETLLLDWPRLAQVQQDFHEWGVSVSEVFVNLVGMAMSAAPMATPMAVPMAAPATAPSPAFKVAENLNLIVNVNWGVHAETYERILRV